MLLEDFNQEEVSDSIQIPFLVKKLMKGKKIFVATTGQHASGKTFTMKGEDYALAENLMISESDPMKHQYELLKGRAI